MSETKPFWQSKTLWVQTLAVLSMFAPPVAKWVSANPVEFITALSALNTIVRFATSGAISIFSDDDQGGGRTTLLSGDTKQAGRDAGPHDSKRAPGIPWLVAPALAALLLPSCVVGVDDDQYTIRTDPRVVDRLLDELILHEDNTGAKDGLRRRGIAPIVIPAK